MTLRFADGFDHYAVGDVLAKWTSLNTGPGSMVTGRFGTGQAIRFAAYNRTVSKVIDAQATWIVGAAFWSDNMVANEAIFQFFDGATLHCDLRVGVDGKLFFTRNGTVIGSVGTTVLSLSTWYYIEAKVTISDTVGVAVAKINGVTELNGSALDTRNAGNATADTIRLQGSGSGTGNVSYDDLYICDAQGSTNNDFLGDVRVEALFPNGDGNSSVLVGSDGNSTNNSLLVDETTPATADYVESSTVGDKDTYAFTNPTSTSGTVYGVQVLPYAAKTDAGTRSIVSVARLSGTEVDSSAKTLPASGSPTYLPDIRETKPGGGAWSITDVTNAEFGVKINA